MGKLVLEEIRVYGMAETLADEIWGIVSLWPAFPKSTIGHQLVRAADSVGANIAEGFGRAYPADHRRFIRTARGSLYEVRHFLRRADKRGLISREARRQLQRTLQPLLPSLNAYLRSLRDHGSNS